MVQTEPMNGQNSKAPDSLQTSSEAPRASEGPQPLRGPDAVKAVSEILARAREQDAEERAPANPLAENGGVLANATAGPEAAPEAAPEAPAGGKAPRTVPELAEALGVDAADVYDALEIGFGDGSKIKLGELKDQHAERVAWAQEIAAKDTQLTARESAIRQSEGQLSKVLQLVGHMFTPEQQNEIVQEIERQDGARMAWEGVELQRAVPEIQDASWRRRFEEFLITAGPEFRIRPDELTDHRHFLVLKALMDERAKNARLSAVIPGAIEPPGIMAPQGRGGGGGNSAALARAKGGTQADKVRAVSSIIGGRR